MKITRRPAGPKRLPAATMTGAWFMLFFLWLAASALPAAEAAASFQTNFIEGWRVLVNERLLKEERAATEKALELLRAQLQEIIRVVPAPAVTKLREVPLWFSPASRRKSQRGISSRRGLAAGKRTPSSDGQGCGVHRREGF